MSLLRAIAEKISPILKTSTRTKNCTANFAKIEKTGQRFTVDSTDFTGVLKVTDATKFSAAVREGIGGCGKAFGFGMLLL